MRFMFGKTSLVLVVRRDLATPAAVRADLVGRVVAARALVALLPLDLARAQSRERRRRRRDGDDRRRAAVDDDDVEQRRDAARTVRLYGAERHRRLAAVRRRICNRRSHY